jgi:hypothetical protein
MITLQMPENELEEMKQFYLDEYDRTSARLQHILTILNRLGLESPPGNGQEMNNGKAEASKQTRKKPGRKSKWEMLIMKRLRQLDRPVTYDELTEEIMTAAKIPPGKRDSTRQAIVNVVFRLRNRDRKLDTFSMGTREKYIALRSWFKAPGVIKTAYAKKTSL